MVGTSGKPLQRVGAVMPMALMRPALICGNSAVAGPKQLSTRPADKSTMISIPQSNYRTKMLKICVIDFHKMLKVKLETLAKLLWPSRKAWNVQ